MRIETRITLPIILVTEISQNYNLNVKMREKMAEIIDMINNNPKSLGACTCNIIATHYFITPNKNNATVDLNPLLDYLCKMDYLQDMEKSLQPIVLFLLDGTADYAFTFNQYKRFKRSYIYNNSLRMISWVGNLSQNNIRALKLISNKNFNIEEMETIGQDDPRQQLYFAIHMMQSIQPYSDVIGSYRITKIVKGSIKYIYVK